MAPSYAILAFDDIESISQLDRFITHYQTHIYQHDTC